MAGLLIAASASYVLVYLMIALARINYPFELEWVEGGMVDHVRRVIAGAPIYAKPTLEFVSFLYPPLYYMVAAAFAKILGAGFFPLRLLSFLSSLGVFFLIYRIVRRETGAKFPGVVAVGLFAATYDKVGGWFDIARLDSFYMLLLLAGVYALRFHRSAIGAVVAGTLMGAAFLTKQSALVIAVPMAIYVLLADFRRGLWFVGTAAGVMVGGVMLADWRSGGWFHYYCFYLPSRHPRVDGGLLAFWTKDFLPALPVAAFAAAVYAGERLFSAKGQDRFFFPVLVAGLIGSSWSVRNMVGAELNNLIPAFTAISILAALGIHRIRERWPRAALLAEVMLVVQLALLVYNPARHVPTPADRAAGEKLVSRIAAIHGDVWIPHHGYLAILAGKRSFAHAVALDDIHVEDDGPAMRDLETMIVKAVMTQQFGAVFLESDDWHKMEILNTYEIHEALFDSPEVFWPITGARLRPEALCFPRSKE